MRSTNIVSLIVALLHIAGIANTANILSLVEVLTTPDQQIWHDAIYKGLIDRGHKLTVVSGSRGVAVKSPAIVQIHLEEVKRTLDANEPPTYFANTWLSAFERVFHWYDKQMRICQSVLASSGLQELIELSRGAGVEEPFDLILFDATYGRSCLLAVAQLFGEIPIVAISASYITPDLLKVARGAQIQPATVPHFTTVHDERMNFLERLHNTAVYTTANFFRHFTSERVQEAMLAKSAQLQEARIEPTLEGVIERVKVVLVNSHPAIDYIHALPPNVIEVGGLHFDNINRPLSVEMQTFIDNSKEGVFIVTLGIQGNFKELTPELIEALLNTIDSFPEYGFIWGVDKSVILSWSSRKNLFVGKWLKRSNILAQRKVKGLIATGSHMEVQAAAYHGVPIISVSNGYNQPNTARRAVALGFGVSVDISTGSETLRNAISAITMELTFEENAKSRQIAFRGRPQNPLDVALWWIEYVLEHPIESGYLFSQAAAESSFFALHSLDAVSVLVFMIAMFLLNCVVVLKQLKENFGAKAPTVKVDKSSDPKRKLKKANGNKKKSE
ncbi:UDP-glucosyltransferase 2 [Rhagoletis pomonella]|uniref:UDP-glucosyltransferase 2 n=1 Tax=Rhagoletis pomonella TaxID=28610 RepID=UPI001782C725|nr:UDP-glucosyltransferase 2 [Rhagoletis pomonella]